MIIFLLTMVIVLFCVECIENRNKEQQRQKISKAK